MDCFHNIIATIRKRPPLYLGSYSITALRYFLDGYRMAQYDMKIEDNDKLLPLPFLLFTSFVGNYCIRPGYKSGMDWRTIILNTCENDEENALHTFYSLYDKFMGIKILRCYRAIFGEVNIKHHNTAYEATKIIVNNKTLPVYNNPLDAYILKLSDSAGYIKVIRTESGCHLDMWIEPSKDECEAEIARNFGNLHWHEIAWNESLNNSLGVLCEPGYSSGSITETLSDKEKLIAKFGLFLEYGGGYSQKENSHKHLIFKDSFYQKQDVIGLLFRINKLCMAKVKYFRSNIDKFEPYKYDCKNGFVKSELWDSEFLKHKVSGYILDYRFLQSITIYSRFAELCNELESAELK